MTRLTPGNAESLRGALRVAAGDQDTGIGILAMNAANGSAGVLVGGSRDGTGIEYDDFGSGGVAGALQSARRELALDGGTIRLGCTASEVLDMILRHKDYYTGP